MIDTQPNTAPFGDLPIGLAMMLAEDPTALSAFAALSPARQKQVIRQAHTAGSREEMHALVDGVARRNTP